MRCACLEPSRHSSQLPPPPFHHQWPTPTRAHAHTHTQPALQCRAWQAHPRVVKSDLYSLEDEFCAGSWRWPRLLHGSHFLTSPCSSHASRSLPMWATGNSRPSASGSPANGSRGRTSCWPDCAVSREADACARVASPSQGARRQVRHRPDRLRAVRGRRRRVRHDEAVGDRVGRHPQGAGAAEGRDAPRLRGARRAGTVKVAVLRALYLATIIPPS